MVVQVKYIAQSGFLLTIDGKKMIIDPWVNNPLMPVDQRELEGVEYVFLTHAHADHGPDQAVEISKTNSAYLISPYDFSRTVSGQISSEKLVSANVGGFFNVGDIEVKYVNASHTSDIGLPVGYMIRVGGKTIYHMGDTGYQSEYKTFGELYDIDLLFVPIGSVYTMDPLEASVAVGDFSPEYVIPMHYNTFPKIAQDPENFLKLVGERSAKTEVLLMKPGDTRQVDL